MSYNATLGLWKNKVSSICFENSYHVTCMITDGFIGLGGEVIEEM